MRQPAPLRKKWPVGTFVLDGPEKCSGLPVQRLDSASLAAELERRSNFLRRGQSRIIRHGSFYLLVTDEDAHKSQPAGAKGGSPDALLELLRISPGSVQSWVKLLLDKPSEAGQRINSKVLRIFIP